MEQTNTLNSNHKIDWKNRIIWILLVTIFWYVFLLSALEEVIFDGGLSPFRQIEMSSAVRFTIIYYLSTIVPFIGVLVYTLITKRNRFIFRSFMPSAAGNHLSALLWGLLVGFVMNFGCIVWALLAGDIKLYFNFTLDQIPFYLFALVCVFIQSSSEEMWCRGFMYERINVHYPLWVAILVNGLFFAALHVFNDGAGVLPIADIAICGLSFSIAKGTREASGFRWVSIRHGTSPRIISSGCRTAGLSLRHPSSDWMRQTLMIHGSTTLSSVWRAEFRPCSRIWCSA